MEDIIKNYISDMKKSVFSDSDIETIVRMRAEGRTITEIANTIHKNLSTVYYYCFRNDVFFNKDKSEKYSEMKKLDDIVIKLYNTYDNFDDMIAASGLSKAFIARRASRLRKSGIYVPYIPFDMKRIEKMKKTIILKKQYGSKIS